MFIEAPGSGVRRRSASIRSQTGSQPDASGGAIVHAFETELEAVETSPGWMFDGDDDDEYLDKDVVYRILDGEHLTWNRRFQDIFDGVPHRRDFVLHLFINLISILAIVVSCTTFCIMTLPENIGTKVDQGFVYSGALFLVDAACVLIFVVEIAVRIWARKSWQKLFDVFFVIDVVTILGFGVDIMIDEFSDNQGGVALVRLLRLFRVFRVFKLSRHSKSLQLVVVVLKKSASGLTVLTLPLLIATLIFSSVIYFFEVMAVSWDPLKRVWRKDNGLPAQFQSIPDAIWFTTSTVTTVGFGDIVPVTVAGRIIAVMASFFGILILSFPNIVLGGNLQFAFRAFYRHRARKVLGKKFRKVFYIIVFCQEVRRLADERAALREYDSPQELDPSLSPPRVVVEVSHGDEAPTAPKPNQPSGAIRLGRIGSQNQFNRDGGKKSTVNFLAQKQELDFFKRDGIDAITDDNIRQWHLHGLRPTTILRRLLELCSGVGTVQELHQSFVKRGEAVASTDIALVALHLMAADFLQVFVFRRGATNMLLSLTQKACVELLVHPEEGVVDCIRSIDVARLLWKRTTQLHPQYSLQLLIPNYAVWAATEKMVDNKEHTPNTDGKITFWKMSDRLGGGGGLDRRVSALQSLTVPRVSNVTVEEAKSALKAVLTLQRLRIAELEKKIADVTQETTNAFGL